MRFNGAAAGQAAFHAAGAKLVIVDLAGPDPVALARDIGGDTLGVNCNVTDSAQVTSLVAASVQPFQGSTSDHLPPTQGGRLPGEQSRAFPRSALDAIIEVI